MKTCTKLFASYLFAGVGVVGLVAMTEGSAAAYAECRETVTTGKIEFWVQADELLMLTDGGGSSSAWYSIGNSELDVGVGVWPHVELCFSTNADAVVFVTVDDESTTRRELSGTRSVCVTEPRVPWASGDPYLPMAISVSTIVYSDKITMMGPPHRPDPVSGTTSAKIKVKSTCD